MAAFSYLELTTAQRWALVYRATGLSLEEVAEKVPNSKTGEIGIDTKTISQWQFRDHVFRQAWRDTEADPSWAQRNVIMPWLLTTSLVKDLEYLHQTGSKGFSPKKMELLMTHFGLINQVDQTGAQKFQSLIQEATLRLPPSQSSPQITVVDVTPELQET